ncbi:Phosphoribosyl pyrophosphate synthase-associated protein 1 [Sparganum proliferum]
MPLRGHSAFSPVVASSPTLESRGIIVLAGNSHPDIVKRVCNHLSIDPGKALVCTHSNKETKVQIYETVRGRDVYIIQTGTMNVNNDIMELLVMAFACRAACARRIVVVMPYLPYCKQNKMRKRGSITCKLIAKMICSTGVDHVITMDLHSKEIQGFFDVPVDNLRASPFLIRYICESIPDYRNCVIVARSPNGVARATSYAERLRVALAVIHGVDREDMEQTDGRTSPPIDMNDGGASSSEPADVAPTPAIEDMMGFLPAVQPKEKPQLYVVGNVNGKIAIIVDDIIDDVSDFVTAAELLHSQGAYKVYVLATHGLLTGDAANRLEQSLIDEVVVTNTVPHVLQKMQCHKIRTVDISILLAEAIRRIHNKESMSYLFMDIPKNE